MAGKTLLTDKVGIEKILPTKECPATCPNPIHQGKNADPAGDLAGGGPMACRYTCGHVIPKADLPGG